MIKYTTFLFARPSFWEGVGRIVDFGGTLSEYNRSRNGVEADINALRMDWYAVGQDLRQAAVEAIAEYKSKVRSVKKDSE